MGEIAIQVNQIGKRYRLGPRQRYRALRDTLSDWLHAPQRAVAALTRGQQQQAAAAQGPESFWALKDVSFEVGRGEALGIVGRNGAGKSTLLKILSRVTRPTEGRARIYGRVGSLLEVGTGFHPELTGRENIFLNGTILGMRRHEIARKFDAIVDFAEIEQFIDTPVKHYSSGMYTRLAFAVAAHLEPEILLVDEVLAVGDVAFQKKCLGKMGEVAGEGRTVLFVSHNMAAMRQLCQKGLLIHQGQLVREGPIDQIIQQYIGTVATSDRTVEIAPSDHATGLHGIQVIRVSLLGETDQGFTVPWRQPIRLLLAMRVTRAFPQVSFGLGFITAEGVPLMTVHDLDCGGEPAALAPGDYEVEVTVQNPLRLGIYNLVLGAHEAVAKSAIFYIPNAIRMEVVNATEGADMYHEHNSGLINGDSSWLIRGQGRTWRFTPEGRQQ